MIKRSLRVRSLDGKMFYMVLLSLLCAAAVYLLAYSLAGWALREIYMSPESRSARQAEIYSEFFQYVTSNQITGDNADAVARWTREHPYVSIQVYEDEELNSRGTLLPPNASSGVVRRSGQYDRLYPMRFADGLYRIAISDTSDVREDNINRVIALLLGSIAFVSVLFAYIRRLTRRIIRLSREAAAIGAGDLEAPITAQGEDELSALAADIDAMRRSVIERMSGERRAWEANSELITAISHDIRTPMTSLIGYLGLLNEELPAHAEKSRQFAASAYGKAMELKELTDELFKYFLVFGHAELELHCESFDGGLLLEQLLGEAEFDLLDAGFTVKRGEPEAACSVTTDPLYLKRVMDNLVSNVKKYADRASPVELSSALSDGRLSVRVANVISQTSRRGESNRIGLRTCEKIMAALGGTFTVTKDREHFSAEFDLPVDKAN